MKFRESVLAHKYLDGLEGLEIGASAHNPFGLKTKNVDYTDDMNTIYKKAEIGLCGEAAKVDIVAAGDNIPLPDKSVDFIINSHVIEHFFDPIVALNEWKRLARKYIFIICPHHWADPTDRNLPITTLQEIVDRHDGKIPNPTCDAHHTRWTPQSFLDMCKHFGFNVIDHQQTDDKAGNGFTIVIKVD